MELIHACPRVLTSDHKARHYGRWAFLHTIGGWGFVAEVIAVPTQGGSVTVGCFPAILNLKLKPLQSYLQLTTLTSSQPKGTTKALYSLQLRSLVPFGKSRKKIRRFRIFHAHCSKSISPDRRCPISKPTKPISAPCHYGPASEWVISATQPFLLTLI